VLRAGAAYSVTGRALNLGEGGIAISLADEVRVSDAVAVEFLLPDLGLGLQARALVRYRVASHAGLEFRDLTRHQQAVIREWTRQRQSEPDQNPARSAERPAEKDKPEPRRFRYYSPAAVVRLRRLLWPVIAVLALIGFIALWHWERAWKDLEDQVPQPSAWVAPIPQPQLVRPSSIPPGSSSAAIRG
jgi:hypothetical protein